jgi:hypothetical protein
MIGAHFPPDTSAGTHRLRLLAPHLPMHGWEPTVLTVDPRDYESRLDEGLAALVPENLRVVRCRAWSAQTTRKFGFGDLGLRSLRGLCKAANRLLAEERFDALFITIYPSYVALLGSVLKKKHGVPFTLDYQDPWVGAWGGTVGGGPGGAPDFRSRASLRLAKFLEPRAARAADALVAVSQRTLDEVIERNPALAGIPMLELPIGGEPADFEALRRAPRPNPHFNPADGDFHLCYVGTLLPLGFETLRAVLGAVGRLKETAPGLYERLRLRFFGASNQTDPASKPRVLPVAAELGVADRVSEVAPRLDYLDALAVQTQASALLLMGSSERHYTASKLYPALLAERPLLAVYHQASTVTSILRQAIRPPSARLVTYDDDSRAESTSGAIAAALAELVAAPAWRKSDVDESAVSQFSAAALAGKLAGLLDRVAAGKLQPRELSLT